MWKSIPGLVEKPQISIEYFVFGFILPKETDDSFTRIGLGFVPISGFKLMV